MLIHADFEGKWRACHGRFNPSLHSGKLGGRGTNVRSTAMSADCNLHKKNLRQVGTTQYYYSSLA